MASDQLASDVAKGNCPVSILGCQCAIHLASNVALLLSGGFRCVRSSHVRPLMPPLFARSTHLATRRGGSLPTSLGCRSCTSRAGRLEIAEATRYTALAPQRFTDFFAIDSNRTWFKDDVCSLSPAHDYSSCSRMESMAPKYLKDKEQIGRFGEAGLFLVSDRTLSWEWQPLPRRDPKPACERLDPIRASRTRATRWPNAAKT